MTKHNAINFDETISNEQKYADEVLNEKMKALMTPGLKVECDPDEAERLGAFAEDALSEEDAFEGVIDLLNE
ncbi:hypothetical protein [Bartonella sp. F02]|uniref:hypothetical protein n=1 Tax=Bartonella sp. F02 TaxID=2967262 RepID=UPI0022A91B6B|nr:hypothetical protein [Bartonella sp. F02]MCZ2328964.1 hypothetical protein [Bartonella sp. F02]